MSDPIGISARPPIGGTTRVAVPGALAELLSPPSTLGNDATVLATVLDRAKDGALLLRSPYGIVSLRTAQTLPPGTRVELRVVSTKPPSVSIVVLEPDGEPAAAVPDPGPAMQRPAASPAPGEPAASSARPPAPAELSPARANGWTALDQILSALDKSTPALAAQLRAELTAGSGPALGGTLLFILGTLYNGRWPGEAVARALTGAMHDRLRLRLGADIVDLSRLSADATTGDWQVLTLPLLSGDRVQPLRLYLRRRDAKPDARGDGKRFVIEAELSRLGPLQLDGMVRASRLDLVLRSHAPLPDDLRRDSASLFHAHCAAQGLSGEIVFATVAEFAVAPLVPLIGHVALSI